MPAPTPPDPIDALPPAPSRTNPANFSTLADALLGALGPMVTQINLVLAYMASAVSYVGDLLNGAAEAISEAVSTGIGAIETAVTDGVAVLTGVVANAGLSGTSTSSVTIGTGSKTFTTQPGLAFRPGGWITLADTANPTTKVLSGQVTAYNPSTGDLTVNVAAATGSGTVSDWQITAAGRPGSDASIAKGTGADINAGTDDAKYITAKAILDADAIASVAASGSFTLNMTASRNFSVTLSANSTMAVPTGVAGGGLNGQSGYIYFIQDATGSRTLALNAAIKKFGSYTLTTTANGIDRCGYVIRNGVLELTALEKGLA